MGKHSGLECRDLVYGFEGPVAALGSGKDDLGSDREREYYHLDRNGTIKSITDQNGTTVAKFSYSAFGIPNLIGSTPRSDSRSYSSGDQYFYAGHRWDADAGLYYFGTRFYDPRIGQFLSPDADIIIASGGINTYAYARSNPNRWVDPDGRQEGTMTTGGLGSGGGGFLGGSLGTNGYTIPFLGGGPNLGGFSGSGPSFSSSPNLSFNFGPPGVHGGNLFFGGASGSNATPALATSGLGTLNFSNSSPMLGSGFQGGVPVMGGGGIGNDSNINAVSVQPETSPSPDVSERERQWEIGKAIMDELGGGDPSWFTPIGSSIDLLILLYGSPASPTPSPGPRNPSIGPDSPGAQPYITPPAFNPNDWGW